MDEPLQIYFAAALFSGRETYFNRMMTNILEDKGYTVKLPQRDGFEFGNLTEALTDKLEPKEVPQAVQNIIYFLDMGIFVAESDVIIANLDEPLDEGVVVEIAYARILGKYVIGYRTDVRAPYGGISELAGGTHFFPVHQCDVFIKHPMSCQTKESADEEMSSLADLIDSYIQDKDLTKHRYHPNYVLENPNLSNIIKGAEILFKDIGDIHSDTGIDEIVQRYIENKDLLETLG